MGNITGAFIFPHPPIMVEEVGKDETVHVKKTIAAAHEAARRIKELKPDTIIVITPHGTLFSDAVTLAADKRLEGSLAGFGAPQVRLEYENDMELTDKIIELADKEGIFCVPMTEDTKRTYRFTRGIDHGALVPLYFVDKEYRDFRLVQITYSLLPREDHYRLGMAIRRAVEDTGRSAVVIASGDLSHRLTHDAPSGYNPRGAEFDELYTRYIGEGNVEGLITLEQELLECAGECGYISTLVLLGCFDTCGVRGEVLSYEGPFGVGYCIAELTSESCGTRPSALQKYMETKEQRLRDIRGKEDPYVSLARSTLENYVINKKLIKLPEDLPGEMLSQRAGVFVSIKKNGELRGCIGTISPTEDNIAGEIVQNAISAGTRDPRFSPVRADELGELVYSVDVLMEAEPISSKDELDVRRYGLIVRSGNRSGLLLPNLEGVDTVDQQISITLQKAGIRENEKYTMSRFEVIRHH